MLRGVQGAADKSAGAGEEVRKSLIELQAELTELAQEVRKGFVALDEKWGKPSGAGMKSPREPARGARVAPAPELWDEVRDSPNKEQRGRQLPSAVSSTAAAAEHEDTNGGRDPGTGASPS